MRLTPSDTAVPICALWAADGPGQPAAFPARSHTGLPEVGHDLADEEWVPGRVGVHQPGDSPLGPLEGVAAGVSRPARMRLAKVRNPTGSTVRSGPTTWPRRPASTPAAAAITLNPTAARSGRMSQAGALACSPGRRCDRGDSRAPL